MTPSPAAAVVFVSIGVEAGDAGPSAAAVEVSEGGLSKKLAARPTKGAPKSAKFPVNSSIMDWDGIADDESAPVFGGDDAPSDGFGESMIMLEL